MWHDQFCFEVLSKGLPIPGSVIPLPKLSALDLEWRTIFAVRVQKAWTGPTGPLRPVLRRGIPAAQQAALRIGGCELLTLHTGRFITWRLNKTKEPAADNIIREQLLGTNSTWKIYRDSGVSGTIAIANRWVASRVMDTMDSADAVTGLAQGKMFSYLKVPSTNHPCNAVIQGMYLGFSTSSYSFPPPLDLAPISTSTTGYLRYLDLPPYSRTICLQVFCFRNLPSLITQNRQFGKLITFAELDSHLLVFRETCLEIYAMPTLPGEGQSTVLEPIQVFILSFPIQSPVVCTPCTPLTLPGSDFALPSNSKYTGALSKSICYQIAGTRDICGYILTRSADSEEINLPLFRLVRNPSIATKDCTCMRVGHSGRGLWLDSHNNIFRCNTASIVMFPGGKYPTLDMGQWTVRPLCTLPGILKDHDGDLVLDFDEGMCRIVYCDEAGLVSVVDVM